MPFVHLRTHTEYSVVDGTLRIDAAAAAAARRRHAGAGHHRPEQPVRRGQVLQGLPRRGRQAADRRRCLDGAAGRAGGGDKQRQPAAAAGAEPARLPEPVRAAGARPGCTTPSARRPGSSGTGWRARRRPDRAVGRRRRRGGHGAAGRRRARAPQTWRSAWPALFPRRFYLELQRAGLPSNEAHVRAAVPLAARLGLPVVATHPVQFLEPDDFEAHEARVCIAEGETLANPQAHQALHARAVLQDAGADGRRCSPTCPRRWPTRCEIARRCNLTLVLGKPQLPDFPTPETACRSTRLLPRGLARRAGAPAGGAVPRRGPARRRAAALRASGWNSRSRPSSRWASRATS